MVGPAEVISIPLPQGMTRQEELLMGHLSVAVDWTLSPYPESRGLLIAMPATAGRPTMRSTTVAILTCAPRLWMTRSPLPHPVTKKQW